MVNHFKKILPLLFLLSMNMIYPTWGKTQNQDSSHYYLLLDSIDQCYDSGDLPGGIHLCEILYQYCEVNFATHNLEKYDALSYKSLFLLDNSEYKKAEAIVTKVLDEVEKYHGKDNLVYGATLLTYADILSLTGRVFDALETTLQLLALDTILNIHNSADHSIALNNIAVIYADLGESDKALVYLNKALPLTDSLDLPFRYENIAVNEKNLGNFFESLKNFEKALTLYHSLYGSDHLRTLNAEINYCILRIQLGEFHAVKSILEDIESILVNNHTTLNKNHDIYARLWHYLFLCHFKLGNYEEAEIYAQLFYNTCTQLYGKDSEYGLISKSLMVEIYEANNQLDKADSLNTYLLEVTKEIADFKLKMNLYAHSARIKLKRGNIQEGVEIQNYLLKELIAKYGKNNLKYIEVQSILASIYYRNGLKQKAREINLQTMNLLTDQIVTVFPYLSEQGKILFKNKTLDFVNFLFRTFDEYYFQDPEYADKMAEFSINYSGLAYVSSKNYKTSKDNEEVVNLLRQTQKKIAANYLAQEDSTVMDSLLFIAQELERKVSISQFENLQIINLKDWLSKIPKNESVVQYISYKDSAEVINYYAFLYRGGSEKPKFIHLNCNIRLVFATSSEDLFNTIWKPIEVHLNEMQSVNIVPDQSLHEVSFYKIRSHFQQPFLFEKYKLSIFPNMRSVLKGSHQSGSNKSLIFGDVAYIKEVSKDSWGALPYSKDEIHSINRLLAKQGWEVRMFDSVYATKSRLLNEVNENTSILHVASHGKFVPIQNYSNDMLEIGTDKYPMVNALFQSGIQLSNWSEEGFLSGYEISNIPLVNLDLVVLSSCESGLGGLYSGEGVFGVRRGFLMSGAKNIISTLEQVPDHSTFVFMDKLYGNMADGKDLHSAFKSAQIYMKDKYPPEVWTAFVLIGNGSFSLSPQSFQWTNSGIWPWLLWLLIPIYFFIFKSNVFASFARK